MRLARIIVFALLYCGLCWGQAADQCTPSSLNVPGAKYPCVYPDGRATYRVLPGPRNRAMAGLSMGGMQTFRTALANLDKFQATIRSMGINVALAVRQAALDRYYKR